MADRAVAVIHGGRDKGSLPPFSRRAIVVLFLLSMLLFGPSFLLFIPEAHAQSLVTTIPLGSNIGGLAYDSAKGQIFVSEGSSGSVAVISDSSDKLVTKIPVSSTPGALAYDPNNGDVYVGTTTLQSYTVSVISDSNDSVVKTIEVGYDPYGLAYDSGRGEIYVANYASGTVSVISDSNNSVVKTINLSNAGGTVGPGAIAYDSNKGELFVADSTSGNVSVISDTTNAVVANISVAAKPLAIAYDSGNGEVFVASSYASQVDAISASTNSLVANLTGVAARALTYDSAMGEMFVGGANNTAPYADELSAVSDSTNRVVASLAVSSEPGYLADDPGTGDIIAGYSGGIYVIPDSLQTISGTTTISSSIIASSSSSSPTSTSTVTNSSSSLHLDQPQATLSYGQVTCTVNKPGAAADPCTSIDPCDNGNPCFASMSTGSATLVNGATGVVLEGFPNINFNVTEAGPGQLQLSYILYFNTGACGIPLQGEDQWELSGIGTNFTGQYTISTPCISWTAPVTLTLAGTGLTQGTPTSTSTPTSASTSTSTPTTPAPAPPASGNPLLDEEIIGGVIAGAVIVGGALYYFTQSGGNDSESEGGPSPDCVEGPGCCGPAIPTQYPMGSAHESCSVPEVTGESATPCLEVGRASIWMNPNPTVTGSSLNCTAGVTSAPLNTCGEVTSAPVVDCTTQYPMGSAHESCSVPEVTSPSATPLLCVGRAVMCGNLGQCDVNARTVTGKSLNCTSGVTSAPPAKGMQCSQKGEQSQGGCSSTAEDTPSCGTEEVIVAGCSAHPTICNPCGPEEVIVAGCSAHPTTHPTICNPCGPEEVIVAGCSSHAAAHSTVCGPCGPEEVIVAGCAAHPTACVSSTATGTHCGPQGKVKVVKKPSCSSGGSSSSSSCSSTAEDTPPSCQ